MGEKKDSKINNDLNRTALLYITQILEEYTDAEHFLSQEKIAKILDELYGMPVDRKLVGRNLAELREKPVYRRIEEESALFYDVEEKRKHGVALTERLFSEWELRFLIDSVLYSKALPKDEAKLLIKKLRSFTSVYTKEKLPTWDKVDGISRTTMQDFGNVLTMLTDALHSQTPKKVHFTYNEYSFNYPHADMVSVELLPVGEKTLYPRSLMIGNDGYYYLVGTQSIRGKNELFRVDMMTNVTVSEGDYTRQSDFNAGNYLTTHPHMTQSSKISAKVRINKDKIGLLIDSFGVLDKNNKVNFRVYDGDIESYKVEFDAAKEDIVQWALQHAEYTEIISPIELREQMLSIAKEMRKGHMDKNDAKYEEAIVAAQHTDVLDLYCVTLEDRLSKEKLPFVKTVNLRECSVKDLAFLKEIPHLSSLCLLACPIHDISILSQCSNLKELDLRELYIASLDVLRALDLDSLILAGLSVEDYTPLYEMKGLKSLTVDKETYAKLDVEKLKQAYGDISITIEKWLTYHLSENKKKSRYISENYPYNFLRNLYGYGGELVPLTKEEIKEFEQTMNLLFRKSSLDEKAKKLFYKLYKDGESYAQIAKGLDIVHLSVDQYHAQIMMYFRNPRRSQKIVQFLKKVCVMDLDKIIKKVEDKLLAGDREFHTLQALNHLEYFQKISSIDTEDRKELQAVVGFDYTGFPRLWDMTKGNMFMHSVTGDEVETLGATAIVTSLVSRFTKEELCYWFVAYQSENLFPTEARAYCKEYVRYVFNDNKDEYTDSLLRLQKELERRAELSKEGLEKEPFMLVVLETPCLVLPDSPLLERLGELLFEKGKDLKCACLLLSNRTNSEWMYRKYKDTFTCEWTGVKEFSAVSEQEAWVKENSKFTSLCEKHSLFGVFSVDGTREVLLNPYYPLGLTLGGVE